MSGICGLFNLDDKPVVEPEVRAMTAMLKRRGPDADRRWNNGPVGLGHTLLATTPELLIEPQPFEHPETGCVITADVRLDNREELIAALDIHRDPVGDAEIILGAYLKWGGDCPNHLLGDFAFAIWDPRHKRVFCARDHSGMRQLYYHHKRGSRFLFATEARAILVLPQVPYHLNQGRIADFLIQELEWIDYTSTFFEDVYRLPPGHCLTATRSSIEIIEYWRPTPRPEPGKLSDDEWREGFLTVFTQATDARLRVPGNALGSMLSGGMDSGSIAAVAKERLAGSGKGPLHTYSCTSRAGASHPEHIEIDAVSAASLMPELAPTLIYAESIPDHLGAMVSGFEEPFDGQCILLKSIYRAAAADGRRVVLDGAAGDVVLDEGSCITRLIRSGRLITAMRNIAGEKHFWESESILDDTYHRFRSALAPDFVKRQVRKHRRRNLEEIIQPTLISRRFAEQVDVVDRMGRMRQIFPQDWNPDYAVERCDIIRPNMTGGRERYARLAACFGVEASDPFMDKRVIDYCSRLPAALRLRNGWRKIILRDLMVGRLPDTVRWATGKHHLGWVFNAAVTNAAERQGFLTFRMLSECLQEYVDKAKLIQAWRSYESGDSAEELHTAFMLSQWLHENGARPVVTT
jgi:asparagine synthase (glutamine-hydrolysing)